MKNPAKWEGIGFTGTSWLITEKTYKEIKGNRVQDVALQQSRFLVNVFYNDLYKPLCS